MALNKHDVWVGAPDQATVGPIFSAPLGKLTDIPADISSFNDAGFVESGYISEDGLSIAINREFEEIRDWSLTVVRKLLTNYSGEFKWSHISMTEQAWKNFAGDKNVTFEAATNEHGARGKITFNASEPEHKTYVFKIKDGDRRLLIIVPDGTVQGDEDLTFKKNESIGLGVLLTTYPDKDGNHFYILFDDGQKLNA